MTTRTFPRRGLAGASPAALGWLTGSWLGKNGDDPVEEHWAPLRGDALMGMFRWVKDGKVFFYELFVIEKDGEHVFFRIKHFDPGLKGWEEKDEAAEFLLVHLEGREAAFLELHKPAPRWAVYRREGEDRLVSYFASPEADVTETGLFEYARVHV
jgi:hypothetical protein